MREQIKKSVWLEEWENVTDMLKNVPLNKINYSARHLMSLFLNYEMELSDLSTCCVMKNWKGLAELTGLSYLEIRNVEQKDDKIDALMNMWQSNEGTIFELIDNIHCLDRYDLLENSTFMKMVLKDIQYIPPEIDSKTRKNYPCAPPRPPLSGEDAPPRPPPPETDDEEERRLFNTPPKANQPIMNLLAFPGHLLLGALFIVLLFLVYYGQHLTSTSMWKLISILLVVVSLVINCQSWWFRRSSNSRSSRNNNHQNPVHIVSYSISSQTGLTNLYNSNVIKAELVERPLAGSLGGKHSGVLVTLENGDRYLVHKGDEFGRSSQTIVVDAKAMSDRWRVTDTKEIRSSNVADFVRAGGEKYNVVSDNCHDASKRMMNQN